MRNFAAIRPVVLISAVIALSACVGGSSGSGGGGGGGGGGGTPPAGPTDFDAAFDRVTGTGPSSDVPTSIKATYTGAAKMSVTDGSETVGEVLADLDLALDWVDTDAANETGVWSGSMSGFRGTIDGTEVALDGQLDVIPDLSAVQRTVIEPPVVIPGGPTEVSAAGVTIDLTGTLTYDGTDYDAGVKLGGTCFGPQCSAIAGPAVGGVGGPGGLDYTLSGTYYAER